MFGAIGRGEQIYYTLTEEMNKNLLIWGGTECDKHCYAIDTTFRPAMNSRTTVAMMIDFGSRLVAPWLIMPMSTSFSVSHTASSPPRVTKSVAPTAITNTVQRRANRLLRLGKWCMTRRLNPLSAISRLFSAKKSFRSLSLSISRHNRFFLNTLLIFLFHATGGFSPFLPVFPLFLQSCRCLHLPCKTT